MCTQLVYTNLLKIFFALKSINTVLKTIYGTLSYKTDKNFQQLLIRDDYSFCFFLAGLMGGISSSESSSSSVISDSSFSEAEERYKCQLYRASSAFEFIIQNFLNCQHLCTCYISMCTQSAFCTIQRSCPSMPVFIGAFQFSLFTP